MTIQNIKISISEMLLIQILSQLCSAWDLWKKLTTCIKVQPLSFLLQSHNLDYWSGHQFKIRERAVSLILVS